jgi:hypothetical protein
MKNATQRSLVQVNLRLVGRQADSEEHRGLERLGAKGTIILGVPAWLYEHLSRFMESRGLRSVAEFVVHVLSTGSVVEPGTETSEYSDEELKLIRRFLQSMS